MDELEKFKKWSTSVRQPKIQATIMRSRAKIYEMAEKPTSYVSNIEKRNYVNKVVTRVNTGSEILTDQVFYIRWIK